MNTPSRINTAFQLCDGSDSEGKIEDASISLTLSHVGAPELQNISRIAESIKTQDFLTSIYVGVSGRFPVLSFAMSRASVNSDMQIPVHVLMINQCHLFRPSTLWNGITHSRLCTVQDVLQFRSLRVAKCWG